MDSMRFFRKVDYYRELDRFYGGCWDLHEQRKYLTCPIPFNLFLRVARALWLWLMRPFRYFDVVYENCTLRKKIQRLEWDLQHVESKTRKAILHELDAQILSNMDRTGDRMKGPYHSQNQEEKPEP